MAMLPRERVEAALSFRAPDVVPLQIHPSPAGLFEHGQRLLDLFRACGHDFGDAADFEMPTPPGPGDWDADGHYHVFRTDEWGTRWEHRLFGVWGYRIGYPLADLGALDSYRAPEPPACEGLEFEADRAKVAARGPRYYTTASGGLLFEQMQSLRAFEDVLIEIHLDAPEINRIADLVVEYNLRLVERALALDVDAVTFGDDYGGKEGMLISIADWRRFFRPRYERLFEPVLRAGKRVFFHCCGQAMNLLPELAELGASAVWPQLTSYDEAALARRCRELGLAIQLHPDRGDLMQRRSPEEVRAYVRSLVERFGTRAGGSWLYVEIDPGFPFENVRALVETAMEMRLM
jgi:hypothetical protein